MDGGITGAADALLFVYGTLRRGCTGEKAQALHQQTEWLGQGSARGHIYRLGWYPAFVTDVGADAGWVRGDVLRMAQPEATLAWLDVYEECTPDFPEPHEYRREVIDVVLESGAMRAWAYVYARPVDGLEAIIGGDWLACQYPPAHQIRQPHRDE